MRSQPFQGSLADRGQESTEPPASTILGAALTEADGRRNYDGILAAARAAFDDRGADASLDEIARAAGVAIGTLYGHFPSREALIEASIRDGLETVCDRADELAADAEPLAALTGWLPLAIAHCSTFRGLVGFLATSSYDEGTPLHHSCLRMHETGARLLHRAQKTSSVRPDLTPEDLFTIITSAAWARDNSAPGHDQSTRLLELVLDGITLAPQCRQS